MISGSIGLQRLVKFALSVMLPKQQQCAVAKFDMRYWRLQEIRGTCVKCGDAAFSVLSGSNNDRRNMRANGARPDFTNELCAVHFRHTIVNNQQVSRLGLKPLQSINRAVKTLRGELRTHHGNILRVNAKVSRPIIHNDNARMHENALA